MLIKNNLCQCGCGELCYKNFKQGHGSKTNKHKIHMKDIHMGKNLSEEHRKNISKGLKGEYKIKKLPTKLCECGCGKLCFDKFKR